MRLRSRSAAVAMLAGVVALALAGCSPEEPGPTASPTSASSTPTQVETTSSPTPPPSPTPTLTQEAEHVAEATETLKSFIQVGSDIANAGGVGGEEINRFLGTPELQDEYSSIWKSLVSSGTYTVGTPAISQITVNSYGLAGTSPTVELRYCLDNSAVTQFDGAGAAIPRPGDAKVVLITNLQRSSDGIWTVFVHNQTVESC